MSDVSLNAEEQVSNGFLTLIAAFDRCADDIKIQCAEALMDGQLEHSGILLERSKAMQAFRKELDDISMRWSKGLLRLPSKVFKSVGRNKVLRKTKRVSPNVSVWMSKVAELKTLSNVTSWQGICNHLGVATDGDSARRRLKKWIAVNNKNWPEIPEC